MNAFSTTLLILAGLQLLAPAAHAFFWSCPNLASDESVANTTEAIEMMESMFPAYVYLKKGKNMEEIYSCITIETFDSYQTPPPPAPDSRFFLDCIFDCPGEEEEPKPYNATITFYVGGESMTANTNISYIEADGYVTVVLSGVPEGMFGERRRQTKLRLASVGDGYFVLIDCSNYFLSFGHEMFGADRSEKLLTVFSVPTSLTSTIRIGRMKPATLHISALLPMVVLVLLPTVNSFFWACNNKKIDVPSDRDELKAALKELFPARLYLRKTSNTEERRYSCVEIEMSARHGRGLFSRSFNSSVRPLAETRDDETETYSATLKFMESQAEIEEAINVKIIYGESDTGLVIENLPVTMFQSDRRSKTSFMTLRMMGDNFAVFDACETGFLSFSNTRSSYMFVSESFDEEGVDYRCVVAALEDVTGFRPYHPVGLCESDQSW